MAIVTCDNLPQQFRFVVSTFGSQLVYLVSREALKLVESLKLFIKLLNDSLLLI